MAFWPCPTIERQIAVQTGETSPLWDAPNMLITPHISGWFHLEATLNNVVDIAAENLRHLQVGETLRCWIEH